MWNQISYDPHRYECNLCNCIWKPEKFRTSTGFEPVTSQYRCIRSRVQTLLKSWIFQAVIPVLKCRNCVHNCEDHSLFEYLIIYYYMEHSIRMGMLLMIGTDICVLLNWLLQFLLSISIFLTLKQFGMKGKWDNRPFPLVDFVFPNTDHVTILRRFEPCYVHYKGCVQAWKSPTLIENTLLGIVKWSVCTKLIGEKGLFTATWFHKLLLGYDRSELWFSA